MEAYYGDLEYHRMDYQKNLYAKILSAARFSACNSEAIAANHNLSDRSSTLIISFSFSLLVLRNYENTFLRTTFTPEKQLKTATVWPFAMACIGVV